MLDDVYAIEFIIGNRTIMLMPDGQGDDGLYNCSVTAVVLTHNRCAEVLHTLSHLSLLPERPPIIVVDNASNDDTSMSIRKNFPLVYIVRLTRNIGAAARNIGVRFARTPYVALCDDDTWWEPGTLTRAAFLLDRYPKVAVLTGKVLVGSDNQMDPICCLMAGSPLPRDQDSPGVPILGFLAGASVIRQSAFLRVGGFEPRFFIGGEENLVAMDLMTAGWLINYVEELVVHHHPSLIRETIRRRHLLLRNALWTAWLRRPLLSAIRETARLLKNSSINQRLVLIKGVIAGLPWVLRHRSVLPHEVEEKLQLLE